MCYENLCYENQGQTINKLNFCVKIKELYFFNSLLFDQLYVVQEDILNKIIESCISCFSHLIHDT